MRINKECNINAYHNPQFKAIRHVIGKGVFAPHSIEADKKSLECLYKNRFIKKLAKVYDFDVIMTLEPYFHCTKFNKILQLKGVGKKPIPKCLIQGYDNLNNRSFDYLIKEVKELVTVYGKENFPEIFESKN